MVTMSKQVFKKWLTIFEFFCHHSYEPTRSEDGHLTQTAFIKCVCIQYSSKHSKNGNAADDQRIGHEHGKVAWAISENNIIRTDNLPTGRPVWVLCDKQIFYAGRIVKPMNKQELQDNPWGEPYLCGVTVEGGSLVPIKKSDFADIYGSLDDVQKTVFGGGGRRKICEFAPDKLARLLRMVQAPQSHITGLSG